MWKKEDPKTQGVPEISTGSPISTTPSASSLPVSALPPSAKAAACISPGIRIKGEVSGSEDLFVDGSIEGKLNLGNGSLTVGPNGNIKADISAREVVVRGKVDGKITGRERVQVWSTGQVTGEVQTQRLAIEDGAVLRGKVETGRPIEKASDDRSAGAPAGKSSSSVSIGTGTTAN